MPLIPKKKVAPKRKAAAAAPKKKKVQRGGSGQVAPYYGASMGAAPFPTAVAGGDITGTMAMGRAAWTADGLGGPVFDQDHARTITYPPFVGAGLGYLNNNSFGPALTGGGRKKKVAAKRKVAAPKRKK